MYKIEITPTVGAAPIEYYEPTRFWVMIRLIKITLAICRTYARPGKKIAFLEHNGDDNSTQVAWQAVDDYEVFMQIDIDEVPADINSVADAA